MPNVFERPVTGSIRNTLSYKQYISSRPHIYSKYMSKTPFIRVSSNSVQVTVPGSENRKVLSPQDIDVLNQKYETSYNGLVEDVNRWLAGNSDLRFRQTNYNFITKLWSPLEGEKPKTSGLQSTIITKSTKMKSYTWSDIFTSESINFSFDNSKALNTSIFLNMGYARVQPNVTRGNIKFKYDEFFQDPTFTFSDFINVLILSQFNTDNKQFFHVTKSPTKSYYIIKVTSPTLLLDSYNDDFRSANQLEFFVDINDMNKFTFGYDIVEQDLINKFELTKIYYYYAQLGIDQEPKLNTEIVEQRGYKLEDLFSFDPTLAKNNVLQTITADLTGKDEYEIPGGIRAFEEDKSFDENDSRNSRKNTYGLGLRPRPGIVSLEVSTKGDKYGSIKKGKLTLKAFTMEQLEMIQKLYMRPGIFLFIEWGWTVYPELKHDDMPSDEFELAPLKQNRERIQFFNDKYKSSKDLRDTTLKLVKNTFGHYDAMFGVVSNYSWTLNNSGEFDITIDITAHGTSIMSFKPNNTIQSILNGEYEPFGIFRKLKDLTEPSFKGEWHENGKDYIKLGTILDAFSQDISGIKSRANLTEYENKKEDYIAKKLFEKGKDLNNEKNRWEPQNDETKKEYLENAKDILRSLQEFKNNIKTVSNISLNGDPIYVTDISDRAAFLTSIKPDKVLFVNVKNKSKVLKNVNVGVFGESQEVSGKKFVSDVDLREVVYIEKKDTFIENVYKQSNSLDAFFKSLFGVIKDASAEVINLTYTIGNDEESSEKIFGPEEIRIFDINTQDYSNIDKNKSDDNEVKDKPFMFSLNSTSTLIRDFSFSSKLPTSFQRAAFVASSNIAQTTIGKADSVDAMLEAFSGGYKNNYQRFSYIPTLNVLNILDKMEKVNRKVDFEIFFNKLMTQNSDITKFEEHKNEEFMNEFRYYYYRKLMGAYKQKRKDALKGKDPEFMIPPVGINLAITIDGTSGIPWGSLFRVDYLPLTLQKKNRKPTFFVTEVSEVINDTGWVTKLNLLLRSIEEA